MGRFDKLRMVKDAMAAGMRGDGPSEEALASLSPEQRAAYEAELARSAEATAAVVEASARRLAERPLQGPAGEWVYGDTTPAATVEDLAAMSAAEQLALESQRQKEMWGELWRNPLGRKRPPKPSAQPVAADPAQQAAAELAARQAARAPYLPAERVPIRITRIPATDGDQLEQVCAHLAASGLGARPDLVFGAYRVPDHHPASGLLGRSRSYLEWDVVHADTSALAPALAPVATTLEAEHRWVDRSIGEPSVLDEDLAVAYLATAGIGPDRTFGISRQMAVRSVGGDDTSGGATVSYVTGVHVLHQPDAAAEGALEELRRRSPVALPAAGIDGVHVEVLNWRAVAKAVQPRTDRPPTVPSPFPYLPSTAPELLVSYLEVVGVHPAHCYGAAVVDSGPRPIDGRGAAGPFTVTTNVGAEQVCADGERRRRLHAGLHVVVTYLDAPAYVEGRARWASYQREVLQATLENGTGARRPVEAPRLGNVPTGLRGLVRAAEKVGDLVEGTHDPFADHPPHRYCWPPSA